MLRSCAFLAVRRAWNVGSRLIYGNASLIRPSSPGLVRRKRCRRWVEARHSSTTAAADAGMTFEAYCSTIDACLAVMTARLDVSTLQARLKVLEEEVASPTLYQDPKRASALLKERASIDNRLKGLQRIADELASWREMREMAQDEGDDEIYEDCLHHVRSLAAEASTLRVDALLAGRGEVAQGSCFVELLAGAGGTESCDWAEMLLRMYTRWCERRGFSVQEVASSPGEEAGVRSATVAVGGEAAFGWLRSEAGVHRLVRISPFDAGGRRHTSFAQVRVYPALEEREKSAADLPILDKDLRVETMRAQGAGGQHVNTTDSAVRITHIPTGLAASCQNERSQHRNRDSAMRVLRGKLWARVEEERKRSRDDYAQGLGDNAWGNQIRSYVLAPYQMVKDHRTGQETGDVAAVLAGDLDPFVEAALVAGL